MRFPLARTMEGLSFGARAVAATLVTLILDRQEEYVAVDAIRETLGLSDDAWLDLVGELVAADKATTFTTARSAYAQLTHGHLLLSESIGPSSRPSAKAWARLRARVFETYGEGCTYCGTEVGPFVVDHIHPVARGGSSHFTNLTPACGPCNASKGSQLLDVWWAAHPPARRYREALA